MVGYILLSLLAILILILILPMGVDLIYGAAGLKLKLLVGPVSLTLLPRSRKTKEKKKKPKKEKPASKPQAKPKTSPAPGEKKGMGFSQIMEYIPLVTELLKGLIRRLLVKKLVLLVNLAGDDPCDLAINYGRANATVGAAIPLLEQALRIRKRDIQVFCDFTASETEVYTQVVIVACPARLIWLFLRYGIKFIKVYLKQNSQKAV